MQKVKVHNYPLRFTSKEQKNAIKRMAVKNGRSLNAEINKAIDFYVAAPYMRLQPNEVNVHD